MSKDNAGKIWSTTAELTGLNLLLIYLNFLPEGAAFLVFSGPEGICSGIEKVASSAQAYGKKLRNGVDGRLSQIHMSRSTRWWMGPIFELNIPSAFEASTASKENDVRGKR